MEKFILNEAAPILNKLNPDDIPRCIECNLICSLELNYKEGKPYIKFECENKHKGNISLNDYISKYDKFALSKEKCGICGKNQKEMKGDFFYCTKCKQFICYICLGNHKNENKHSNIPYQRYDALCKKHSNLYDSYCLKCKMNLCIYCQPEHKYHDIINLSEFNYSKSKKELEEEMRNIEKKINNLITIKQSVINEINKLKESSELEIKFIKILLYSYEYEENQNNLNYNIIQNLKDFEKKIKLNKIEIYERVYNEGKKYISLIQNLQNKKSNFFTTNSKILKYHNGIINYINKLNDGRLISCSEDKSLNIYKKDSYELQLSIKEHSGGIRSFTELYDRRIITCSCDKTMKLIKLIGEDKYQIEQTLQGHTNIVYKIIEIKENIFISISFDKTMKIWELNYENKFECIQTINIQNSESNCNILRLNENEFVTTSCGDKYIKFWNSNDYSNIATINNIETSWPLKNMCLLENDLLCIGGENSKGFYLIKISTHQLIKNIIGIKTIYSINECLDGLFLCSIVDKKGNNCLVKYKYEKYDLKKVAEKEKAHDNLIYSCVELNDGTIASGGSDCLIKLWED